ncbi:MAG: DUF1385 domain-containing protein [Fimbriimonas sp.]|nr:DUF1385 domain-containing protein [Fimbriimonas sp.]
MPRGEYLQYGGQAVVEGVMMRSPRFFSVACRAPDGSIVLQVEAVQKTWIGRQKWLKLPFLRGSLALLDSMALGSRALKFASNIQLDPAYQPPEQVDPKGPAIVEAQEPTTTDVAGAPSKRIQEGAIVLTLIASFFIGIAIFVYLPNLLAESASRARGHTDGTYINAVAGLFKMVIFFGYIGALGQVKDIREIFKYHGAEHKAINTLEADQPLDLGYCVRQTRLHPRCGTSFAIIVLIIGLVAFTFVPRYPVTGHQGKNILLDVTVRVMLEILILPIISGISYELLRIAGKFRNQSVVNFFFKPGIWSQYLTTREPDAGQIEVALTALKAVIAAEETGKVESEEPVVILAEPVVAPA